MANYSWTIFENPVDFFTVANTFTNDYFWTFVLFLLWIVSFNILNRLRFEKSISISFLLVLIIGFVLQFAGLVSEIWISVGMIGLIVGVLLGI